METHDPDVPTGQMSNPRAQSDKMSNIMRITLK